VNQCKTGKQKTVWPNLGIATGAEAVAKRLQSAAFAGRRKRIVKMIASVLRLALVWGLLVAPLCVLPNAAQGQEQSKSITLTVAAAADLSSALREIAANYQRKTGVALKLSFGASGMLTQEIQNGAPFDVFLSADMDYPRQLIAGGAAEGASLSRYAEGKLILWIPADSRLDLVHQGMNVLLDPSVTKIAIANPQHAPYGRAAVAALKHADLYDRVKDRLVTGENVAQAAQFVESGNAQAGLVALAHALAPGMQNKGKYWEIPAEYYPALSQGAVVLARSEHKKEALDFLQYLKSDEGSGILRKYGFAK
jgi:molybdate transport system substrate-binding protein